MLVIDPELCIDCALCVGECPVAAIFEEGDVPAPQLGFIPLNVELTALWPMLSVRKKAPPDADDWAAVEHKVHLLER